MPRFSTFSEARLATAHPDLQRLFRKVIEVNDCRILEGHRGQEVQDRYVEQGVSQLRYPRSKHNADPSLALDVVPYFDERPHVRWNDLDAFRELGAFVKGVAHGMGIAIVWGGDWKTFTDYPHYELAVAWPPEDGTP